MIIWENMNGMLHTNLKIDDVERLVRISETASNKNKHTVLEMLTKDGWQLIARLPLNSEAVENQKKYINYLVDKGVYECL